MGGEGVPQGTYTHPLPPDRTAYGVLDTLRSVCLLRSRSRTFLFILGKYKQILIFVYVQENVEQSTCLLFLLFSRQRIENIPE